MRLGGIFVTVKRRQESIEKITEAKQRLAVFPQILPPIVLLIAGVIGAVGSQAGFDLVGEIFFVKLIQR